VAFNSLSFELVFYDSMWVVSTHLMFRIDPKYHHAIAGTVDDSVPACDSVTAGDTHRWWHCHCWWHSLPMTFFIETSSSW